MKLHLGCGEKYLEGYVNIDFPPSEHTVMKPKADRYADIRKLSFKKDSVAEVRSHHLFEHFSRAAALGILFHWRRWLVPGGMLVIETPDFETAAWLYCGTSSLRRRFQLGRHIFGSQEAGWADHKDFWDKRKFLFILQKAGFKNITVRRYWHGIAKHAKQLPYFGKVFSKLPESFYLPILNPVGRLIPERIYARYGGNAMPNIVVTAHKDAAARINEEEIAREILSLSLVGKEETAMRESWLAEFRNLN